MHENGLSHLRSEVSGRPGVATAYGPATQSCSHALTRTRLILNIPEFLIRQLPTTEITEIYFNLFYKVTITLQTSVFNYYYYYCYWRDSPQWASASSFTRFRDHTQRRTSR